MTPTDFKLGLYEHYKGDRYIALHLTRHHETGELFVVYVSCKNGVSYIREYASPGADSWTDLLTPKYPADGFDVIKRIPRFRYIGPALAGT
jgi:hypothetical protein